VGFWAIAYVCRAAATDPNPAGAVPNLQGVTVPGLPPVTSHIHVDQFGYLPDEAKVAVISDPIRGFNAGDHFAPGPNLELCRAADRTVVFGGPVELRDGGAVDAISGDRGWWFDFGAVRQPGRYYVFDRQSGLRSPVFRIGADVFDPILRAAVRVFFYQREAIAHAAPNADAPWQDGPSFLQDGETHAVWAGQDASTERDLRGGWADAGDTNKYPPFLGEVIHPLLYAWQANPAVFTDDFNLPESGNGLPDLLDEVKWELDWLMKMQDADGGVFIKMGMASNAGAERANSPYSRDRHPRFYAPKCSASTIMTAGVLAHASRVYAAFGPWKGYAAQLRVRAELAWEWYRSHPRSYDCDTHAVLSGLANLSPAEQDAAEAIAGLHLWKLTGEARYHDAFRAKVGSLRQLSQPGWAPYWMGAAEALFEYLKSPGADGATCARITQAYQAALRTPFFIPQNNSDELYRAWMPASAYHWGSNRTRACFGLAALHGADSGLGGPLNGWLRQHALNELHALHGVNPFSLVYLTNMSRFGAELSASRIYHEWFGEAPPPGYLAGGPNRDYDGSLEWVRQQPPAKAYVEAINAPEVRSYELTEPGIYYQATYVRLLTAFTAQAAAR
jgi:hypothetical protein